VRPFPNLFSRSIRVPVVVIVVLVALVQPALIFALQLMIEHDAIDVRAPLQQARLGLFVRAIDLQVVLHFTLAHEVGVEGLVVLVIWILMAFQEAPACPGQRHRLVSVPGHARGLDQPLVAEMTQVARAWISRAAVMVSEVTSGDHSKGTDRSERTRLRAAQGVLTVAVADKLALQSARQIEVPRERMIHIAITITTIAISIGPTWMIMAVAALII
jgi:hypothetical protein